MKMASKFLIILLAMGFVLAFAGCQQPGPAVIEDTRVTFLSVAANGNATATTTQLTLVFSQAVTGLSSANFTVSGMPGVTIVSMSGSGTTRTIAISGVTASGTLIVSVSSPAGYVISGGPLSVTIYHFDENNNDDGNDEFTQFFAPDFRNNSAGAMTIHNLTNQDMLLFTGVSLNIQNIVGAVRAHDMTTVNFSDRQNYEVGGWVMLQAVRVSEFASFGALSRIDRSLMATYGAGRSPEFRIEFITTEGEFQFIVNNMSHQFALELRLNSPEGPTLALLSSHEVNRVIQTQSGNMLVLFPVWIAFNTQTMDIMTFYSNDAVQSVMPASQGVGVPQLFFNFDENNNDNDNNIGGNEFATFEVLNNTPFIAQFRNDTTLMMSVDGNSAINPGDTNVFELNAGTEGGTFNLNVSINFGAFVVPVRFIDAEGNDNPMIRNGNAYRVTINLRAGYSAQLASSYYAVLELMESENG